MMVGSKADTLKRLADQVHRAVILPQYVFTVGEWTLDRNEILERLLKLEWITKPVIVRSSALNEDTIQASMAGKYISLPNVFGVDAIEQAIGDVICAYDLINTKNQILIQPYLQDLLMSGVAFSMNPNTGGNYYVINFDDYSGKSSSVTSGTSNHKTLYHFKKSPVPAVGSLSKIVNLIEELESIFSIPIDIEFAIDKEQNLYLLQARPLVMQYKLFDPDSQYQTLLDISNKFSAAQNKKPYLYGKETIFGIMPDWNPGELIGIRPRPLALSLYKELITDSIWAYQRDYYGYKNLRSFPLLISFCGSPYIDVRISFNSFLPKSINSEICEKLTNYYIQRLKENPTLHDKVEFEIVFSCFTFDLPERIQLLLQYGFTEEEIDSICKGLQSLTNRIICMEDGLLLTDYKKVEELEIRREEILKSDLDKISKIYWLLEDCKRYGTLPFAGLARGAFIAVQMLQSLVNKGIISHEDYQNFMSELDTVNSQMQRDFFDLDQASFLKKYGHLRPGTYDILSKRYDEDPSRYFDFESVIAKNKKRNPPFSLSLAQLNAISELMKDFEMSGSVLQLFDFIKKAVEGREYSKFIFTKSVSYILKLLTEIAQEQHYTIDEISYLNISVIKQFYDSEKRMDELFLNSIKEGKNTYKKLLGINLPPLITSANDIWSFCLQQGEPNYITIESVCGRTVKVEDSNKNYEGKILLIPNADPGYDWIFSRNIAGFITMYGGVNSHMAIRANELSIPAVIGTGEQLFAQLEKAEVLDINCAQGQIRVIQ
ncbi:PEP/pyruvate-binding domain-containing protein [Paenibacillus agilis]|uniref:Phosphoenolpyruvate synthase n=1 Tax=Paenibacillus agilis TaxID=3020863 RepID=A0A559J107_9BACL|nr:PEP/pyruvate-binding domain-containing protein [Paenibacillus agilis]TVX93575.1 phosphoenolpyruvate synthase [Paenibacillus agilis]